MSSRHPLTFAITILDSIAISTVNQETITALPPIFYPFRLGIAEKQTLNRDGPLVVPSIITEQAGREMTRVLTEIQPLQESKNPAISYHSGHAGEYDSYLGSLIAHPQMLELMHRNLRPRD